VKVADATQEDLGKPVYISEDDTVSLSTTNSILAGYITEILTGGRVMIRIDNAVK
jgi:hypothetical protein